MALKTSLKAGIAEAAEWRLLGLLLRRPHTGWREQVENLAHEVSDETLAAAASTAGDADEGSYLALFGPGGAISPRAVSYRAFADPGGLLGEIAAYHAAFGFHSDGEDPPDHVASLCDFVGYLHLKEAFALARGDGEAARVTAEARQHVIDTHAAPIACALDEIFASAPPSYLGAAVHLLRTRVPFAPPDVLGPDAEEELGCGTCADDA